MKNRIPRKGLSIFPFLIIFGIFLAPAFQNTGLAQVKPESSPYTALLQEADKALAAKDYANALLLYDKAAHTKPDLKYAPGKITEIKALLDADADTRAQIFENIILKAENLYGQNNYPQAKTEYQKALLIDPEAQFPKDRLAEIRAKYTDPDDQVFFNDAVADGDKALAVAEYDKAVTFYETALAVKPDSKAVKDKITSARKQQEDARLKAEQTGKFIAAGDKLMQSGKRPEARAEYQKAIDLTPSSAYAKQKLQEIDSYTSNVKALQEAYEKAVEQADQYYISRDFTSARLKYQEALKAKPEARYPKEMLEKTKTGESQLQSDQQKYDAALASAESFLRSNDFEAAITAYRSASEIKPAETYPKTRIAEIEARQNNLLQGRQAYDLALKNGDQAFGENKYDAALAFYRQALSLIATEKYPAEKIDEITTLQARQKSLDEAYKKSLAEADKLFNTLKYTEAVAAYTRCLELKPGETYPEQRIAEAQNKLSSARDREQNYAAAVAAGDKLMAEQKYDEALASYKQALLLKPAEKYPKDKTAEINQAIVKQKATADKYALAVSNGEKALASGNYPLALSAFKEASGLKPSEQYPKDKITEITNLSVELQKRNEAYKAAVTSGDQLLGVKDYDRAKMAFAEAAELKKDEKYPKEQIAKIDNILNGLRSADENYKQAVTEGDLHFNSQKYTEAFASYKKASGLKPAEAYPATQIGKISQLLADQKKQDDLFLAHVTAADQLFDSRNFSDAITRYRKALELKPAEKYPAEKIAESEKQIADLQSRQVTYANAIAEGEKQLAAKEYENALAAYKKANATIPAEKIPVQKIAEIQLVLDKIKAENERYAQAILNGDKFYSTEKYREALEPYQTASTIKPDEKYPQEQITRINQKLADLKKLDDDYQQLITEATSLLASGKYDDARNTYNHASGLKPAEKLPKDKIAEIENILAAIKLKEENFAKALQSASQLYDSQDLAAALKMYREALLIKPGEKIPQERIAAIEAEIKAMDEKYKNAVALGDSHLASKKLMDATNAYQEALEIKPSETYPKTKIAEINAALAAQKEEMDRMYNAYISEGDKLAADKDYTGAKSAYTKATGIKPAEAYPRQRITEVTKIAEEIELARKAEYTKALGEADKLYNTKVFDLAIDAYEAASLINPNDTYPGLQIEKIRKYMTDHAIQDLFTQTLEVKAGSEKKFSFGVIEPRLRKNNYILLKARSTGNSAPKVYLNYGKDGQKNGGIVLRSLDKSTVTDYIIRISVQDKWYREDNNWISLFVETGDIEISKVQIAAGE